MKLREFHNALRILVSIDADQFIQAVYGQEIEPHHDNEAWKGWRAFRDDPYRWFIRAADPHAEAIWKIMEERNQR